MATLDPGPNLNWRPKIMRFCVCESCDPLEDEQDATGIPGAWKYSMDSVFFVVPNLAPDPKHSFQVQISKIMAFLKAEGLASRGGLPTVICDRNRLEHKIGTV